jgi:hypothetical protein
VTEHDGVLSLADLENHDGEWLDPIGTEYHGFEILETGSFDFQEFECLTIDGFGGVSELMKQDEMDLVPVKPFEVAIHLLVELNDFAVVKTFPESNGVREAVPLFPRRLSLKRLLKVFDVFVAPEEVVAVK